MPTITYIALAILLFAASPSLAVGPATTMLCSGGDRSERPCSSSTDCSVGACCPLGACVVAQSVCDGGTDDGFRCPCPGSVCSRATPCSQRPEEGTCAAGPRAGECCSLEFGCDDGKPCVLTAKVCEAGKFKAAPCLRDSQCPDSICTATALACSGGILDDFACVDDADCPGSACRIPQVCVGDCDASRDVTVDELIVMVSIGLGATPLPTCTAADANRDGQVTVEEILQAVNAALSGCAAVSPQG